MATFDLEHWRNLNVTYLLWHGVSFSFTILYERAASFIRLERKARLGIPRIYSNLRSHIYMYEETKRGNMILRIYFKWNSPNKGSPPPPPPPPKNPKTKQTKKSTYWKPGLMIFLMSVAFRPVREKHRADNFAPEGPQNVNLNLI